MEDDDDFKSYYKKTEIPKKEKSNKGDFIVRDGKLLFNRVGPVNGQIQTNAKAPERRGVWAFPFPIFDYFFVSREFSFPGKMSPKNPNRVKIKGSHKDALRKELENVEADMARMRKNVVDFKWAMDYNNKETKEFRNAYDDLESLKSDIEYLIKSETASEYSLRKALKQPESEPKEYPKAELTDDDKRVLQKRLHVLKRTLSHVEVKTEGDRWNELRDDLRNKVADIEELLSGEGSTRLKHDIMVSEKFNKIKRFWWGGVVYARFNPEGEVLGIGGSGEWYKYTNINDYIKAARKVIIEHSDSHKAGWGDRSKKASFLKYGIRGFGVEGDMNLSSDHMEVFIPM